jgi:hypothetical protein
MYRELRLDQRCCRHQRSLVDRKDTARSQFLRNNGSVSSEALLFAAFRIVWFCDVFSTILGQRRLLCSAPRIKVYQLSPKQARPSLHLLFNA